MNYRGQWNVAAMKGGLYDGVAGPSLFLAQLGRLTGQRKYSDLAQRSMRTSIASLPYNELRLSILWTSFRAVQHAALVQIRFE